MNEPETTSSMRHAVQITLRGRVQGLGVRPAIYRLANQHDLVGGGS